MKRGLLPLRASRIIGAQKEIVRLWHEREARIRGWEDALREIPVKGDGLEAEASLVTLVNTYQWHEEDKARDTHASEADIARVKRHIDASNQRRVNAIERLDGLLEGTLKAAGLLADRRLPLSSETPGSIVDRLSILVLKIYHMADQSRRKDITAAQRGKFLGRLKVLREQLKDLSSCLDGLLADLLAGKRRFKTYYQFKMYNDPETNPYIKAPAAR